MMEVLLIWSVGLICLLSFYLGFSVAKGDPIMDKSIKILDPLGSYREYKEKQEVKKEQEKVDVIMQNIDRYDGTPNGQKDVPN